MSWAAEALYLTNFLDREPFSNDPQAGEQIQELWGRVQVFVTNCQNLPELNRQDWVSDRASDHGGFVYGPTESKAGETVTDAGKRSLSSSGSMTYAGLKSMIYAKMDRNDYRVRAAVDYARRHYTVTENPGMGTQALYFLFKCHAQGTERLGR